MKTNFHKVIMIGLLLAFGAGLILEVMPPGAPAQPAPERRIVKGVDCWIVHVCEDHRQSAHIEPGACGQCGKAMVSAAVPVDSRSPQ